MKNGFIHKCFLIHNCGPPLLNLEFKQIVFSHETLN